MRAGGRCARPTRGLIGLIGLAATLLAGCAWMPPEQTAALRAQWAAQQGHAPWSPASAAGATPQGDAVHALPAQALLPEVPFFPQTGHYCGPAVLATLLGAAGLPADPAALVPQVYLPARQGSLQTELLAASRRAGALAVVLPGRIDAVLAEVAAGRPVGVLLNLGLSWWPEWHYATVVGYERAREALILHSGAERAQRLPFTTFEHTWARAGHWAIAVTRPGQLPATARRPAAEAAALGLERLAPPEAMQRTWQAILDRWPDSLLAALGVGNALFAQSRWPEAAARFEAAAARHHSAAAYNNLALARQRQGDLPAARTAAQAALARATHDEPALLPAIRETLDSLAPVP